MIEKEDIMYMQTVLMTDMSNRTTVTKDRKPSTESLQMMTSVSRDRKSSMKR
jgi:hypothetical protein